MQHIIVDPDSKSLAEYFALIKTPRKNRARYHQGCVTTVENEHEAVTRADPSKNLHAARVYGPSRSSEGQRIYYLVRWLE